MSPRDEEPGTVLYAVFISGLRRRLAQLIRAVDRVERQLEQLDFWASSCAGASFGAAGPRGHVGGRPGAWRDSPGVAPSRLRAEAEAGFARLDVSRAADGSASVRIDEGKPFTLPAKLADLLEVLSAGSDPATGFPPWRPPLEVAKLLGEKRCAPPARAAGPPRVKTIYELVRRLRTELAGHGVNPYFVQTRRGYGIRLALRPPKGGDAS